MTAASLTTPVARPGAARATPGRPPCGGRRPRLGLVRRVRAEIAAGRYLTTPRLDTAIERMLAETAA